MPNVRIVSIIDDDQSVRLALDCLLRSLGIVSYFFASAEDFLRSPRLNDSNCILADLHMPGMGGLQLQEALQAQGSQVPFDLITAFTEERSRERAAAAGVVALLEKPFDAKAIVENLRIAFERHDRREQPELKMS